MTKAASLAYNSIAQMFSLFFSSVCSRKVLCIIHIMSQRIKKYVLKIKTLKINNFYTFVKDIVKLAFFFFSYFKYTAVNNTMTTSSLVPWFMLMFQQFYPPLLLYHQWKCQRCEKGKQWLWVITKIVLTSCAP